MNRLPNFLHIGPGKAGSTWLHEVLIKHPEVFLSDAKDLYFFSRWYDRGPEWYASQFAGARPEQTVVGEVCPDYLGVPEAPQRIHDVLGEQVRLMVTLRDPVTRAFSAYLYLRRHGLGRPTFRETLEHEPLILHEGRYATLLRDYLKYFDVEQFLVAVFDDLREDPQTFLDTTTDWLGITRQELTAEQLEAQLPASKARWVPAAHLARRGADLIRRYDGARLVGVVKRSPLVQRLLYRPLGDEKPELPEDDAAWIREQLLTEVVGVEEEFGLELRSRWGWPR